MKLTYSDHLILNDSSNQGERRLDTKLIEMTDREMKLIATMSLQHASPDLQELLKGLQRLCRKPELLPGLINLINNEIVRQLKEEPVNNLQHNKRMIDID